MSTESNSRYVIGIDLGTTNSALAFASTQTEQPVISLLEIPQVASPGSFESRSLLPSFLYLTSENEREAGSLKQPWGDGSSLAGLYARKRAAEVPEQVVASAKSWLCNASVDRTTRILPWVADDTELDRPRRSPLEASAAYLAHMRAAWNQTMAKDDPDLTMERQQIILTVPASFDAAARDLTVQAAHLAGLENVYLLEEPQAAVYAWLESRGEQWRKDVHVGDFIFVCDVGGGTTDFSLVRAEEEEGQLTLRRVAVGDHLLLGGDNMDLALAYAVRQRLSDKGTRLDNWQFRGLVQSCREAKEQLLLEGAPESAALVILGRGKKLIGGTIKTELPRADVERILVDGFFPSISITEHPAASAQAGLAELGLPYASDPAVTKHMAAFLSRHGDDGAAHPAKLLFNGGVMKATALRERVLSNLASWAATASSPAPGELSGTHPEFAVARGAAYYGLARRGKGIRIHAATVRAYYVGIASAMPAVPGHPTPVKALCVVPFGIEEGSTLEVPRSEFGLLLGETASFRFFASTQRQEDQLGTILDEWETSELEELAPLTVELPGERGGRVPVKLSAHLTEIGTLELWFSARDASGRWKLEFNVRETSA